MRIDMHAHYFPVRYLDLLDRLGGSQVGTAIARNFLAGKEPADLEARFGMMDDAGVDLQVLSVSPQSPYFRDEQSALEAARVANDLYADLVRQHPRRFLAFGCLPLPHINASLTEVTRACDELGMVGITVSTWVLDTTIADPAFEPLFAELDRRHALLFVHAAGLACGSPILATHNLTWPIAAPFEDTMCLLQLMKAGVITRYPRIRIIASHMGGTLPFLMRRLDHSASWFMPKGLEAPSVLARRLWYDTANAHPPALRCACDTFGADRIVLGTDYPYWLHEEFRAVATHVEHAGLPPDDVAAIFGGTAQALLGSHIASTR